MKSKTLGIILCCALVSVAWSSFAAVDSTREEERRARQAERQNQIAQKRAERERIKEERLAEQKRQKEERIAEQKRRQEEALAAAELKREQRRLELELAAQKEAQRQQELEEQRQKEQAEREAREAKLRAQWEEKDRINRRNAIPAYIIITLCAAVWIAGIIVLTMKIEPRQYSSDNVICPKCGSPGLLLSDIHSDGISYGSARSVDFNHNIDIKTTSKHQTGASRRAAPPSRYWWLSAAVGFVIIWYYAYWHPIACCIWPILIAAIGLFCYAHGRKTNAYGRWLATRKCQGCGHLFCS